MRKVLFVFAVSGLIMALATVKAEGAMNGSGAVQDIENNIVVEDVQGSADSVIYKFRIRLRDMNRVMHLDVDQVEHLQHILTDMSRRIAHLENVPVELRQSKLSDIIADNLASVHEVVDDAQYRAYLTLLNNEFNKTGLDAVLFGYNY